MAPYKKPPPGPLDRTTGAASQAGATANPGQMAVIAANSPQPPPPAATPTAPAYNFAPLNPGVDYSRPEGIRGTPGGEAVAPGGFDQTSAGVGEQTFLNHQNDFFSPTKAGQYWDQNKGQLEGPSNSDMAYNKFGGIPADLGPYYDRAQHRGEAAVNNQLAARGQFNSTVGRDTVANFDAALNAERANRESDYALKYAGMGGQLAGQADNQHLARFGAGADMAGGLDTAQLTRLLGAINTAGGAQNLRDSRVQNAFGNIYSPAQAAAGMFGDAGNRMSDTDFQLMDATESALLGQKREGSNQRHNMDQKYKDDAGYVYSKVTGWIPGASGGKTGGGQGGAG